MSHPERLNQVTESFSEELQRCLIRLLEVRFLRWDSALPLAAAPQPACSPVPPCSQLFPRGLLLHLIFARDDSDLSISLHVRRLHLGELRDAVLAQMTPQLLLRDQLAPHIAAEEAPIFH